ncbi:MAG: ABC transporter permease [Treponema sp.]|jgi:simple sugar transport system permease protein|nr:ABC transporter permease [Treponema sp.]
MSKRFSLKRRAKHGRTAATRVRVSTGNFVSAGNTVFIILFALITLTILALLLSKTPLRTLRFFFLGPIQNTYYLGNMLNSAVPLIFGALGSSIAIRGNYLNLGGEGQVYAGGFVATIAALAIAPSLSASLGVVGALVAVLAGALFSGMIAAVSGFMKAQWDTSELITSFLLSSALTLVIDYLITGPFLDSETNLQSTVKVPLSFRLPLILPPSSLSAALFLAIAAVLLVFWFLHRTLAGYEIRMSGINQTFARYGGVNIMKSGVLALFLSGMFYGLAGGLSVFGTYYATLKGFSAGMGWNGLAVALIARSRPQAVIPAAIFFAWIESGAYLAMQFSDVSIELASIVQSLVFFLVSSAALRDFFRRRRVIRP